MRKTTRSIILDREHSPIHNESMKSEKICISKKNLVVSIIVVFLLGVVGVSYMVQKNISTKSRASEVDEKKYSDCRSAFEEIAGPLLWKNETYNSMGKFVDNYVSNQEADAPLLISCPSGQDYPYAVTTASKNCCLNKNSKGVGGMAVGVPVNEGLSAVGLEYIPVPINSTESIPTVPFKSISVNRSAQINSGNAVREEPKTCINYSPVPGVDNGVRSEQYCGPKGNEYEYSEECITSDGKTPGIRAIRVGCGVVGKDGSNSCDFSCFNGVDWNNECRLDNGKKENPSVCLVPSPTPTESPATNTFNSTKQTSNQTGVEVNPECTENPDRTTTSRTNIYMCYEGQFSGPNLVEGAYYITLNGGLRKRVSRPSNAKGEKYNEVCKIDKNGKPGGICVTVTNQ